MTIGVPKEIKEQEYRVALLPSGAYQLIQRGHSVLVERGAGVGAWGMDVLAPPCYTDTGINHRGQMQLLFTTKRTSGTFTQPISEIPD